MVQLTISRPSIKDFFKDLLGEIKDFKCHITLKVLLSKYKENAERKFASVCISSTTKTAIGFEDSLEKSFQEIFIRIYNCICEESGWVIGSTDGEYVNVSIYCPLSGNSYIELLDKLKS